MLKDIKGYEGHYQIDEMGNVWSIRSNKFLKQKTLHGYQKVTLCVNSKKRYYSVHRLVALNFIENPEAKEQVNHKDGNKQNNHVNNLEWCTQAENNLHKYRVLKQPIHNKRKVVLEKDDCTYFFDSIKECAEFLGCVISNITNKEKLYGNPFMIKNYKCEVLN